MTTDQEIQQEIKNRNTSMIMLATAVGLGWLNALLWLKGQWEFALALSLIMGGAFYGLWWFMTRQIDEKKKTSA